MGRRFHERAGMGESQNYRARHAGHLIRAHCMHVWQTQEVPGQNLDVCLTAANRPTNSRKGFLLTVVY